MESAETGYDSSLHRGLHLATLGALAIGQPLLAVLASGPEFFVARRSSALEIVALPIVLVLLPLPLAAVAAALRRRAPRTALVLHLAGVAGLAALLAGQLVRRLGIDGVLWIVAASTFGLVAAWAYRRQSQLRLALTYLWPALIVVPALFLARPQVARVAFSSAAAEVVASGARTPVVLVILDELSTTTLMDASGGIDARSYPSFARLATESTWFRGAVGVSDVTEKAVPAMLSGLFPERAKVPILADYPRNLFTALGGDYRIWAEEPVTFLCPPELNKAADAPTRSAPLGEELAVLYAHLLLPPRFASRLPSIGDRWGGFAAAPLDDLRGDFHDTKRGHRHRALGADRPAAWRRLTAALDAEDDQALYVLHTLLPHAPWEYLPTGKLYWLQGKGIPGSEDGLWSDEPSHTARGYGRYVLQTRFVDRLLGEVMAALETTGLWQKALVVVAADHGVSFRPGDQRRNLTATNAADVVSVPLFVKRPGSRAGEVIDRPVSTLDIVPTILDVLGVEPPWPLDGVSLFGGEPSRPPRFLGRHDMVEVDAELLEKRKATLAWQRDVLGDDPSGEAPLRAGARPELFGRSVDALPRFSERSADPPRAIFQGAAILDRFDPDASWTPAYVAGSLSAPASDAACCELALAVNGKVGATFHAYGEPGARRFAALLPESLLRSRDNRLELFRVRPRGTGVVLESLGGAASSGWSLELDWRGRARAVIHGDERFPVVVGEGLRGSMAVRSGRGEKIAVRGWAADVERREQARGVVFFTAGSPDDAHELVLRGGPDQADEAVARALDLPEELPVAFNLRLPRATVPTLDRHGLRGFALGSDGRAAELSYFWRRRRQRKETVALVAGDGRELLLGAVGGGIDRVLERRGRIVVEGWAADLEREEQVAEVLIFDASRNAIHRISRFHERADVALHFDAPGLRHTGFRAALPIADLQGGTEALEVYAVTRRGLAQRLEVKGTAEGES